MQTLKEQLRVLRANQERLERRLERTETLAAVNAARRAPTVGEKVPAQTGAAVPELAVVKLKPRREPAPKIDVRKPVVEPPPEVVEQLVVSASAAAVVLDDGGQEESAAPVDPELADKEYDQSMEALRTGNLSGAAEALERFADQNPKNPRADNALYFGALGRIGLEEHAQAAELLERLVRDYPAGDAVLDGILKLAECRTTLKQNAEAKALYHQVISTYPGTAAADKAQAKLAVLAP